MSSNTRFKCSCNEVKMNQYCVYSLAVTLNAIVGVVNHHFTS